jgi:hypothetical protein
MFYRGKGKANKPELRKQVSKRSQVKDATG